MFYSENEISKLLNCEICHQKLFDPRCLPCGRTACYDCVLNENDEIDDKFNCKLCSQFHSKQSILVNNLIDKLIELNPNEINRTKEEMDLKEVLRKIKDKSSSFIRELAEPSDVIKEYCMNLKNEVQLAKEKSIESINDEFDKIMIQIDNYEKDKIKEINAQNLPFTKIEIESETSQIINKWKECLSKFDLDNSEIIKGLSEAKKFLNNLNQQKNEFKTKLFNEKILKFSVNKMLSFKQFGNLYFKETFELDNDSSEPIEFGQFFIYFPLKRSSHIKPVLIDETSIYYAYVKASDPYFRSYSLKLCKLNKEKEAEKSIKDTEITVYKDYTLIEKNASNILLLTDNCIYKFDKDLNLESKCALKHNTTSLAVNQTKIFCLIKLDLIYVYNLNCSLLSEIGQKKDIKSAFYMKDIFKIRANDQFLFALDKNNVIFIYNIETGLLYGSFSINSDEFFIFFDTHLLTYNEESFSFYKFDGEKFEIKIKQNNRFPNLKLVGYDQEHLSLLNTITDEINLAKIPEALIELIS